MKISEALTVLILSIMPISSSSGDDAENQYDIIEEKKDMYWQLNKQVSEELNQVYEDRFKDTSEDVLAKDQIFYSQIPNSDTDRRFGTFVHAY